MKLFLCSHFSSVGKSIYFICVWIFALRNCSRVNFHVCKEKDFKRLNKSEFGKEDYVFVFGK